MPRLRHLLITSALVAALTVSASADAHATAAVTAPGADHVWRTGETRNITWTADGQTGAYTIELWNASARVARIGSGADVTSGTHRWVIPNWMPALRAEDVTVKVIPESGATITSSSFDLRSPEITGVATCRDEFMMDVQPIFCAGHHVHRFYSSPGGRIYVGWGSAGPTGPDVKIEVVQVEDGKTTTSVLAKKTPNDGREFVTLPKKMKASPVDGPVHTSIRISSTTPGLTPGAGHGFFLFGSGNSGSAAWSVSVGPMDRTTIAGESVSLDATLPRVADDPHFEYLIGATSDQGKTVEVYRGPSFDGPFVRWAAPWAGTWTVWVTTGDGKGKKATSTSKLIATANEDEVRQSAPSDATPGSGQPVTINWAFFDDPADTDADANRPGVDIWVVNSAGKTIETLASGLTSFASLSWDGLLKRHRASFLFGQYVWRPSSKLPPGVYTVKLARAGSTTTSDQTVTLSHPASVTSSWTASDVEPGAPIDVSWSFDNSADAPVDIVLKTGSGADVKTLTPVKRATGLSARVLIPTSALPGAYTLTVQTTDKFGTAKAKLASTPITFNVVAPVLTASRSANVVVAGSEIDLSWSFARSSTAAVKLELFKGSATKPTLTIARSQPTSPLKWRVPVNLAAGTDYTVKVTSVGTKSTAIVSTSAFEVSVPTVTVTDSVYSAGLIAGQTVDVAWTMPTGVDDKVAVVLLKGTKVVAKLNSADTTVNGNGSSPWTVSEKLTLGDDYSIRVTSTAVPTVTDTSATFSITANPTALG